MRRQRGRGRTLQRVHSVKTENSVGTSTRKSAASTVATRLANNRLAHVPIPHRSRIPRSADGRTWLHGETAGATEDALRRSFAAALRDVAELLRFGERLQLLQRLVLDLADALARDVEGAPHL